MIAVKNILVPTDFSDFSKLALDYAVTFAKTFGAKIIVLHVTPERELDAIRQVSPYFDPGKLEGFLEQRQLEDRKRLDEFIPSESKKGIEVEAIHKVGIPFVEIIRIAKQKKVDLIVMTTHGRSGLSHAIFGSVAEKVVRKSACPVLSIRPPEHTFAMP